MTSHPRMRWLDFSAVQMAPIQDGGAASSSDVAVAEPLPNAAEVGRVSQEAVSNECVSKDKSGNTYTTTARHSRAHTPTTGSLVSSMRVLKSR